MLIGDAGNRQNTQIKRIATAILDFGIELVRIIDGGIHPGVIIADRNQGGLIVPAIRYSGVGVIRKGQTATRQLVDDAADPVKSVQIDGVKVWHLPLLVGNGDAAGSPAGADSGKRIVFGVGDGHLMRRVADKIILIGKVQGLTGRVNDGLDAIHQHLVSRRCALVDVWIVIGIVYIDALDSLQDGKFKNIMDSLLVLDLKTLAIAAIG